MVVNQELGIHKLPVNEALENFRAVFTPEGWESFLEEKGKDDIKYDEVERFLSSGLLENVFKKYWRKENSEEWGERTSKEVLRETIFHTLTFLGLISDWVRSGERIEGIDDASQKGLKRIEKISKEIADFLRSQKNLL